MPELELCTRCGKEVLTSRYAWSEIDVLCKTCAEKNDLKAAKPSENGSQGLFESQPYISNSPMNAWKFVERSRPSYSRQEILVTWSSLIKVFVGGSIVLFVLSIAIISWRNFKQDETPKQFSSLNINVAHQ